MVAYQNQIDDKLWELQKACNRYKETDPLADWVLFAVNRHISTGRATRQFEYDFVNYPTDKLESLMWNIAQIKEKKHIKNVQNTMVLQVKYLKQ